MLTCCPPPLLHLHGKSHKYIYHKLFKGERKKCPLLVLVAHTLDWEESVESVDVFVSQPNFFVANEQAEQLYS